MKINSSLAKLLADELKNTTRQKPLPWSLFMKKYVETRQYTEAQLVDIALAITTTVFTNVFNRINDTDIDLPAAD